MKRIQDHQSEADRAFIQAIKDKRLSENSQDLNYAGHYMYMYRSDGKDHFKNINSRQYDI